MVMTPEQCDIMGPIIASEIGVRYDGPMIGKSAAVMHFTCLRTGGSYCAVDVESAEVRLQEIRSTIPERE